MAAPTKIIDALESIVSILLSGIRHRERAAFILCDNMVEMACKTKAIQHNYKFDRECGFHAALIAPGVTLPQDLIDREQRYRDVRNTMQHANAAATVDQQYCANAVLDSVELIDALWLNTSSQQLPPWMRCALRVLHLYSSKGDANKRQRFEDRMRERRWRASDRENVKSNAIQIELGLRDHWAIAVRINTPFVEECLNELGLP